MSRAKLPLSAAHVWGTSSGCQKWPYMNEKYGQTPATRERSDKQQQGDAAHYLAEQFLTRPDVTLGDVTQDEKGYPIDDEMRDAVRMYSECIARHNPHQHKFNVETFVTAPGIHPTEARGKVDGWHFDHGRLILDVYDFKYGFTIVEVYENRQLLAYVCALLDKLKIDGHADQRLTVNMHIVQPRAWHKDGPCRMWSVNASLLRGYFNRLNANANASLSENAPHNTGAHCSKCPGRHACGPAVKAGAQLYEVATGSEFYELPDVEVSTHLILVKRAIEHLKGLESGYAAEVNARIDRGLTDPNWKRQTTTGREVWTDDAAALTMGELLGVDISKPATAKTPKQAKAAGMCPNTVDALTKTTAGRTSLVPDDHKQNSIIFKTR